jgi:prevent-host-death family protein
MRKVTATELQRNAREVIDQVRVQHEAVVVENRGKPMAVLVPHDEYAGYLRYQKQREADFDRFIAAAEANAALNGYPTEEEAMDMAIKLIKEVRAERRHQASA